MRSSVIFMGALLARCGEARLSLPGGCQLGKRPIDLHLAALRTLGADIEEEGGADPLPPAKLHGAEIRLPFPSVGATENAMLAACAARGETVIRGAAREPEIRALQEALRAMGAEIRGAGTDTVRVRAFTREAGCFRIPPDRIASATFCCACAACGGDLWLKDCDSAHFSTVLYFLNQAGCDIMRKMTACTCLLRRKTPRGRADRHRALSRLSHRRPGAPDGRPAAGGGGKRVYREHF